MGFLKCPIKSNHIFQSNFVLGYFRSKFYLLGWTFPLPAISIKFQPKKKNFSTLELIGDRIFDADKIFKKKKNQKGHKEQFLDFFSPLIQSLML